MAGKPCCGNTASRDGGVVDATNSSLLKPDLKPGDLRGRELHHQRNFAVTEKRAKRDGAVTGRDALLKRGSRISTVEQLFVMFGRAGQRCRSAWFFLGLFWSQAIHPWRARGLQKGSLSATHQERSDCPDVGGAFTCERPSLPEMVRDRFGTHLNRRSTFAQKYWLFSTSSKLNCVPSLRCPTRTASVTATWQLQSKVNSVVACSRKSGSPRGISPGKCLLIATAVAKGSSQVELPDVSLDSKEASEIAEKYEYVSTREFLKSAGDAEVATVLQGKLYLGRVAGCCFKSRMLWSVGF